VACVTKGCIEWLRGRSGLTSGESAARDRLEETPYWHLARFGWSFQNRGRAPQRMLLSVSAGIETDPELNDSLTPYSLSRRCDPKESVFEQVRRARFPHRPSRLRALYVLDDYSLVVRALAEWFPSERRVVHECRLLAGSVVHRADAVWLDAPRREWASNAEKYWGGVETEQPFPEVLVHGGIYFPRWEFFKQR